MNDTTTSTSNPDTLPPDGLAGVDPRPHFERSAAQAADVMSQVRPDQLDGPTPCDAMSVRDLLAHLVMVARRLGCAARGDAIENWPVEDTDVAHDQWAATMADAAAGSLAEWTDEAVLDRQLVLPWDTMSGREAVAIYLNEVVVHTWDLARATGIEVTWDDEVVAVAEAALHSQLPVADRVEFWAQIQAELPPEVPWEDPFASAIEVPDDAPAIDRLVAWAGRTP
ncbi:MAG: TIGR03086 family protein [Acidimicrobiia bacterium]|nr:TIGR03086 family protein [Acidimicrobiia bacterium]